jgi:3-oxoadipate enol-lactonase
MKLAYRLDGAPEQPLLVLSGALGTTTGLWDSQIHVLAAGRRVLRHDLPGHGKSSPPASGPVTVDTIGRALLSLLDGIGIERFSFCGLSLGGMVGMWLGAEAPERVERLVLACTGASLGTPQMYAERAAAVRERGTADTVDGARERWFTPAFRDSPEAQRILDELRTTPAEGYAACCEAVGAFDFHARLEEIAPPTLVIYGEQDPVATAAVADELAGGIRGAQRVGISHAAHLANVEQPETFAEAVLSHVASRASV